MIRGTTALYKFKLPYPKSELAWATVKFWQPNNLSTLLPITKTLEHCGLSDDAYELCFSLTAEETSRFLDKYKAQMQLRAQHGPSATVFGMKPRSIVVYPMNDEILEENPMLPPENADGVIIFDGETVSS